MKTYILIGLLIGAMVFPMFIIPLTGFGMVIWGLYVLLHDIVWQEMHHHKRA